MSDRAYSVFVEWDKQPSAEGWVLLLAMAKRRLAAMLPDGEWEITGQEMPHWDGMAAFTNGSRGLYLYATPAAAETPKRC